jgi:hypothetical protein
MFLLKRSLGLVLGDTKEVGWFPYRATFLKRPRTKYDQISFSQKPEKRNTGDLQVSSVIKPIPPFVKKSVGHQQLTGK